MRGDGSSVAQVADGIRAEVLQHVTTLASDAFKEGARITSVLDDKAQKAAQTAGLFLAAGFAVMKPGGGDVAAYVGQAGVWTMAGAVALLMLCIGLTVYANWPRRMPTPVNPATAYGMAGDLADLPDDELTVSRQASYWNDVAELWIEVLQYQQRANRLKAGLVRAAQILLAVAMMLVGVLLYLGLSRARAL